MFALSSRPSPLQLREDPPYSQAYTWLASRPTIARANMSYLASVTIREFTSNDDVVAGGGRMFPLAIGTVRCTDDGPIAGMGARFHPALGRNLVGS